MITLRTVIPNPSGQVFDVIDDDGQVVARASTHGADEILVLLGGGHGWYFSIRTDTGLVTGWPACRVDEEHHVSDVVLAMAPAVHAAFKGRELTGPERAGIQQMAVEHPDASSDDGTVQYVALTVGAHGIPGHPGMLDVWTDRGLVRVPEGHYLVGDAVQPWTNPLTGRAQGTETGTHIARYETEDAAMAALDGTTVPA